MSQPALYTSARLCPPTFGFAPNNSADQSQVTQLLLLSTNRFSSYATLLSLRWIVHTQFLFNQSDPLQLLSTLMQNPSRNLAHEFVKIIRMNIRKQQSLGFGEMKRFPIKTFFNGAQWIAHEQCAKLFVDDAGTHETIQIGLVHAGLLQVLRTDRQSNQIQ